MKKLIASNIAVLVTCYNRKQKTLAFLDSICNQAYYKELQIDFYLLDDGSSDGTSEAVNKRHPNVNVIHGNGSLFWAGGMRAVWKHAMAQKQYDIFLLFNDDVVLMDGAFEKFMKHYEDLNQGGVVLVGSTLSPKSKKFSYGGHLLFDEKRPNHYPLKPDNTKLIPCNLGNANILLVDGATVEKIGIFSEAYTHGVADYDYTLAAYKNGLNVLIAPGYYGYCENDHGVNWVSQKFSLKKRLQYLHSPKGLAYKEYLLYIKKFFPGYYPVSFFKLWMKTLFPFIWDKFKKRRKEFV